MRKINFIIACGTLAAIGTWQLASMAQQPKGPKPRLDAVELEDSDLTVEQQIEILTEQAVALTEEAASLSRNAADREERGEHKERLNLKRLDPNLQELQAKTQALSQVVKQMHEAKAQEAQSRGKMDEARRWADAAKSKLKAEAKEKARRVPRVDYREPIRTEAAFTEVSDEMRLHPGAHVTRNVMIQDHNGKRIVVQSTVASPEDAKRLDEFRHLIGEFRKEKDPARKEELKANIREKLESQLDRDIDTRKTQLSQMEERVEKLRNQLEASENSKPATVDSLLQMLDGDSAPFAISPAWIDALSAVKGAGPYQHTINFTAPEVPNANQVMVAPLAIDLGGLPESALPQLSVGTTDIGRAEPIPDTPVAGVLPALPSAPGAAVAPPAVPTNPTIGGAAPSADIAPLGVAPGAAVAPPPEPTAPVAIEHPEVPEQPEQPELPEPPEAPEAPEQGR